MCGLTGAVWKDGALPGLVESMTRRLAHRGPDDEAFWRDSSVHLGFRRLSIIDPQSGRQPVFDEDGSVVALCNGEVYNHGKHRDALAPIGHRFASGSDAEVIPHLYEEHGASFPEYLHGKFAVALFDSTAKRLVLARDRLGIKPLYYVDLPSGFYFASELKSLLLAPDFEPVVDRQALDWLLAFKHIPGDSTLLENVRMLQPGHTLIYHVDTHRAKVDRYYQIPLEPIRPTIDEAADEVRRRLDEAVRVRLMSDVPIGVSLSGGLDSSAVVASVARQTDRPPRTFSVFAGDRVNELPYAEMVAERYKTDHHEVIVEPEAVDRVVPSVLWHLEEPLSISEVPTYYLGMAVGGRVKVLLCGEGADELFGGYKRFIPINQAGRIPRRVATWGYVRGLNGLTGGARSKLYASAQAPFNGGDTNPWLDRALEVPESSLLNRMLRYELVHELRSQVGRLDKLTMAHGVEARCPFLDPLLVDYVANLPSSMKVRRSREKVLLKAAMVDRLPAPVVERRKFGFSNPVVPLFQGGFRDLCYDTIRDNRHVLEPYFDVDAVGDLFGTIGRAPLWLRMPEMQIFHVYLFLKWHELFVQGNEVALMPKGSMTVRQTGGGSSAEPERRSGAGFNVEPERPAEPPEYSTKAR